MATVVVAEDEAVLAAHLETVFGQWGYPVVACGVTADQVVDLVSRHAPDLVVMDIRLHGGEDGIDAARRIREVVDVPVIYLTALADEQTIDRARATAPYGYVLKPFSDIELRITVEMALQRHRAVLALRRRTDWLDAALNSAGEAVLATDRTGAVVFMNTLAEALTGWAGDEAAARPVGDVLRLSEPFRGLSPDGEHLVERVVRTGAVTLSEPGTRIVDRQGASIPVECCAAPARGRDSAASGVVVVFRDVTQRQELSDRLVELALRDPLTGLLNRISFRESLRLAVAQARRSGRSTALMLIDLDFFKTVNDTLGHVAGDRVLVETAMRITDCVRESDVVARLGGDEIAVIQSGIDDRQGAVVLAAKLLAACDRPIDVDGVSVTVTASIGIALVPGPADDPEEILRAADGALYQAKKAGRNRFVFAGE